MLLWWSTVKGTPSRALEHTTQRKQPGWYEFPRACRIWERTPTYYLSHSRFFRHLFPFFLAVRFLLNPCRIAIMFPLNASIFCGYFLGVIKAGDERGCNNSNSATSTHSWGSLALGPLTSPWSSHSNDAENGPSFTGPLWAFYLYYGYYVVQIW